MLDARKATRLALMNQRLGRARTTHPTLCDQKPHSRRRPLLTV